MNTLNKTYKIIKITIISIISTIVGLLCTLYILLSIPAVQNGIKGIGEEELSKLLHAKIEIKSVSISPFNQLVANNIKVYDQNKEVAATIDKLGAGFSFYNLIFRQRLVFTYAEIINLNANIYKETPQSPTNIQFIIDALSKKDTNSKPSKFDVKIYNIVIRKSSLAFNVLSEDYKENIFDKNHIEVQNLTGDIVLPLLKNDNFIVNVKRLAFNEKSGFTLKSLALNAEIRNTFARVRNFRIELPNSTLATEDFTVNYSSLKNLKNEIFGIPINLNISNSFISPNDFACFSPNLSTLEENLNFTLALRGTLASLQIPVLNINSENNKLAINISGNVDNLNDKENLSFKIPHIKINAKSDEISTITSKLPSLSPKASKIIANCGNISLDGSISGSPKDIKFLGSTNTSIGNLKINAGFRTDTATHRSVIKGYVKTPNIKLGKLISKENLLGDVSLDLKLNVYAYNKVLSGKIDGNINHLDFKGYRYNNIIADIDINRNKYSGELKVKDENIDVNIFGTALIDRKNSDFNLNINAQDINLNALNLFKKHEDKKLSFSALANFSGNNIDNASGYIEIDNLNFVDNDDNGAKYNQFLMTVDSETIPKRISLKSDVLTGELSGQYSFKHLVPALKDIFAKAMPTVFPKVENKRFVKKQTPKPNDFVFNFTVEDNNEIFKIIKSPVTIVHPIKIHGKVNTIENECLFTINAPYIKQKNKIIDNTFLKVEMNEPRQIYEIQAHSVLPTKSGNMALNLLFNAANDRVDTDINWKIDRKETFEGKVNLSTLLFRDENESLCVNTDINSSDLIFNDTIWNVMPAKITYADKVVNVSKFEVKSLNQFVKIEGKASPDPEDQLIVDLEDINLDYIFETLNIPNVSFGGQATGRFFASNLFTKIPTLNTPKLHVINFSYNNSLLGNTDIESHWVPETKAVDINAEISQRNGHTSFVNGAIFPTQDSLYIDFKTDKIDVGFLKPYMSAFTSDISGYASGNGTLFGNFKRINFMGDIYGEDLKIRIDYLNTNYTCTDSIHVRPDIIDLDNITIYDKFGKSALLNGRITHEAFHNARFDFSITNAQDFLCYDITPSINPIWYGTIFGNGSAFVKGAPGIINIDVNMSTAPKSKFTFVLSDQEAAGDYNFITFVDRNKKNIEVVDTVPEKIRLLKAKKDKNQGPPTQLNLNLQVEATPQAQMVLVMDPVGGDKIRARGSGNLKMAYNSYDDELTMMGKYTLEKGYYNFTLQDIIIKEFTIKDGSSISFNGDPLAARLDISAIYSVNASLTDLDESFALDKDMNRTNVPVHAVLKAAGDIREPSVSFDLEFPTLTQEAYRKIKSIISTEDMMNMQIIYLVALNRFYTPEYTNTQSNNSELANVASSTISSQLSSMLGQIDENWTIAPNFRTNKGDFSDIEVDLALSSQLLNNRLILNGNFGYRDNSLNANSSNFIGDFDIEYLLTKNGSIRLKAYNRYNDQNYYIKSALTTQGIGVVFKHDFDRLFDFLKKKKKPNIFKSSTKNESITKSTNDSISKNMTDSIHKMQIDSIK